MTKQEKIERYVQVGGKWRKVDRVPDMVEVVRCKDCKYLYSSICAIHDIRLSQSAMEEWFCADGEKGEQNDETN